MDKKKFFGRIAVLLFCIFITNALALYFHWYSSLWWLDMLMHFLGGLWLGLIFLWFFPENEVSISNISKMLILILLVGIFWEIFELLVINKNFAKASFDMRDTISDLFFDLSGGSASYLYFLTRIMQMPKVAV